MQAEEGMFQWLPFLYQAGGSIDQARPAGSGRSAAALADFVKSGIASRDVINQRQYEVTNTFMAGNTAMILGGPWELPRMKNEAKFEWRLALLPVKDGKNIRASSLGGYDCIIPKGAREADGAFRFIEFMSNPKIVNEGWNTGRLAPRTDVVVHNPLGRRPTRSTASNWRARGRAVRIRNGPTSRAPIQIAIQEAITGSEARRAR